MSPEQRERLQLVAQRKGYMVGPGYDPVADIANALAELAAKADDLANVAHFHFREMKERKGDSHEYIIDDQELAKSLGIKPGGIARATPIEWPLDRDGGVDPIGRCAEPTYQDEHREANARYRRALDQIKHGDRFNFAGQDCEVLGEEGDGAAQASISGSQTRARVRDELRLVLNESYTASRESYDRTVDRILDRLGEAMNAYCGCSCCQLPARFKAGEDV